MKSAADLYLDLLKKCLINSIYRDVSLERAGPMQPIIGTNEFNSERRAQGSDWPSLAHSMVGMERLSNVQTCIVTILEDKVPGDLIECGVWRGGATILMQGVLAAYSVTGRKVWVADSFKGLPAPSPEKFPLDKDLNFNRYKYLAVSREEVCDNFRRYGLLEDNVQFLEGWFKDTLPAAPIEHLALLRIDGDLYESTTDALESLYPKVSPGGFVIIDDFNDILACRQAVLDYRGRNGISALMNTIDWSGIYWRVEA